VTTNYDTLLEQAFRDAKRPYHLVVHATDRDDLKASVLWWKPGAAEPESFPPNDLPLRLSDTSIIYKLHGSVNRVETYDNFVISEDDYIDFIVRMGTKAAIPSQFELIMQQSPFLFLGYSLVDWNLRLLLRSLKSLPSRHNAEEGFVPRSMRARRSWAFHLNPSTTDEAIWVARGVTIHDATVDHFVEQMEKWIEDPTNRKLLEELQGVSG
jgi:hypothetical protein